MRYENQLKRTYHSFAHYEHQVFGRLLQMASYINNALARFKSVIIG